MVRVDGQSGDQANVRPHRDRAAAVRSALRAAAEQLEAEELQRRSADERGKGSRASHPPPQPPTRPLDPRPSSKPIGDTAAYTAPASRLDRHLGIKRDRRDRWLVLKSLEGQRVTVLAGFKHLVSRTGTLVIFNERRDGQPRFDPPSIVIDDGRRRWFPITEVHSITDPADGAPLGGPW
jgi:hypothetical protein